MYCEEIISFTSCLLTCCFKISRLIPPHNIVLTGSIRFHNFSIAVALLGSFRYVATNHVKS